MMIGDQRPVIFPAFKEVISPLRDAALRRRELLSH
jgi:hypothetical protein